MERRLSAQTNGTQTLWRGTKKNFQNKVDHGEITDGTIYFVGLSESDNYGFADSEEGFIAVGKPDNKFVKFTNKGEKGDKGEDGKDGKDGQVPDLDNIYKLIATKTSKEDVITFYKSAYSPDHNGENEYQRILSIKPNTFLTMNVVSSVFGSTAQNTIWFSGQSDGCLFSVFGTDFVWEKSGGYFNLLTPTLKYNTPAVPTYHFQIVQLRALTDDSIVWYNTENTYTTATKVNTARVVWRNEPPTKEDSVSFGITGGDGSVNMSNSINFIGDVNDSSTTAEIVVSGHQLDKIYQFTFTKKLSSLVLKSSSGVAYCTIDDTINQGDVVTITSVANVVDGWLYSTTKPSISPADESIDIEWIDGVAYIKSSGSKTTNSEDLTDKGYKLMNNVQQISQTSGKPTITNFITGKISFFKDKQIILKEYFDKWIELFVPWIVSKVKAKKVYYVPNSSIYNIPSDADVLILRRSDFPDDTSEMASNQFNLYLPDGIDVGREIKIINTNYNRQTQGYLEIYIRAKRGRNSENGSYLYSIYTGNSKTFTYYGGEDDDYNGGWIW